MVSYPDAKMALLLLLAFVGVIVLTRYLLSRRTLGAWQTIRRRNENAEPLAFDNLLRRDGQVIGRLGPPGAAKVEGPNDPPADSPSFTAAGQHKVLLLTENPNIQLFVGQAVEAPSFRLEQVVGWLQLCKYIGASGLPDLLLLHIRGFSDNDFEVCRRLRCRFTIAELPIIILADIVSDHYHMRAFEEGANRLVGLPVSPVTLITEIASQMRWRQAWQSRGDGRHLGESAPSQAMAVQRVMAALPLYVANYMSSARPVHLDWESPSITSQAPPDEPYMAEEVGTGTNSLGLPVLVMSSPQVLAGLPAKQGAPFRPPSAPPSPPKSPMMPSSGLAARGTAAAAVLRDSRLATAATDAAGTARPLAAAPSRAAPARPASALVDAAHYITSGAQAVANSQPSAAGSAHHRVRIQSPHSSDTQGSSRKSLGLQDGSGPADKAQDAVSLEGRELTQQASFTISQSLDPATTVLDEETLAVLSGAGSSLPGKCRVLPSAIKGPSRASLERSVLLMKQASGRKFYEWQQESEAKMMLSAMGAGQGPTRQEQAADAGRNSPSVRWSPNHVLSQADAEDALLNVNPTVHDAPPESWRGVDACSGAAGGSSKAAALWQRQGGSAESTEPTAHKMQTQDTLRQQQQQQLLEVVQIGPRVTGTQHASAPPSSNNNGGMSDELKLSGPLMDAEAAGGQNKIRRRIAKALTLGFAPSAQGRSSRLLEGGGKFVTFGKFERPPPQNSPSNIVDL